ncbi:hypothetical protein [Flavobacterium urocaniciphilum]|uniref:Uncharacterized protein n=1 Tax=Flavobacterium urocaniciphilum TaxID=1299341 RepID=A0A1H9DW15_9FLAO|nr:hypothetical protein [Flavobacterium urocaniciphilum]SEQ17063.1 hypothetical protein SAMN05444005_10874 [Flavobacterium urocaniciphilum]
MKTLKSTLESFKENELSAKHKINVYGGIADGGTIPVPGDELIEDPIYDDNGDPVNNGTGPRSGGGSSSSTTGATLGNDNTSGTTVITLGK